MNNSFISMSLSDKKNLIEELKHFYIPYRDSLDFDKSYTFGCEIEFNMKGYYNNINDIKSLKAFDYMKSIGYKYNWNVVSELDNRLEIVSDVLTDKKENWLLLNDILLFLNNNGAYYNGKGGSHVHVGNQIIANNFDSFIMFLKIFACYENEIIRFTNGEYYFDRVQFEYMCNRSKKIIFDMLEKKDFIKRKNVSSLLCNKMYSINFFYSDFYKIIKTGSDAYIYNKANTTEFRTPTLTLNPVIWQNNINFFVKLMSCMKREDFDISLLNYRYSKEKDLYLFDKKYSSQKAFELCDLVFNNSFDKYCFLRQYYKDFDESLVYSSMSKSKPFYTLPY